MLKKKKRRKKKQNKRRILRRIKMLDGELEQDADDLVFHPAQLLGAAAAVAILEQQLFGLGAARR